MNFKEVYTDANNEIHGSDALLEKILSAPEKRSFRIPYVVSSVAIAAIIAVAVLVPGVVKQDLTDEIPEVRVADSRTVEQQMPDNLPKEPEPVSEAASEPVYDSVEPEISIVEPEMPTAEPIVSEEVIPDVFAINYVTELTGGEAMVISRALIDIPVREMTEAEYREYIGKDISGSAVIPGDMILESPEYIIAETDENGEIVSEKAIYLAHSEDYERFAEINVTRTKDILIPDEGMEASLIGENSVIIVSDYKDYNASFSDDGVQYFIRCAGVTEDELKNLLVSLN